ncbi:hypothetical protein [Mucilaginibacter sp. NFX135]|uniref:hypothetical protein n=1 Tax=Mucilaginibacter sp. NFX135 TaxID=3402687 RepID=UPI003AFABE72
MLITAIALLIFTGGLLILHTVPSTIKDKVADGLLADFIITFPVFYYFIVIRPFKKPVKNLLIVISICSVIAYLVLPAHQQQYILQVRKLTALAELLFLIYAITKIKKLMTFYKIHQAVMADPIYNLRSAMGDALGDSLGVKVIASELAVLRYGLLCWRKERSGLQQSISFSTHKEAGYIAIWCVLVVAIMVEVTAIHLLLLKWSHIAAMVVTILSLYGVIFIVADLSAIIKRKVQISDDHILLQTGLRWRARTSLSNIGSIKKITNDYQSESLYFKGGIIKTSGSLLISFKTPVQIDQLYGSGKQFNTILMNIDNYDAFANTLRDKQIIFE